MEEVTQGVIEGVVYNAIFDADREWFSLTDPDAVVSGKRAVDEFVGGVVLGGIFTGFMSGAQKLYDYTAATAVGQAYIDGADGKSVDDAFALGLSNPVGTDARAYADKTAAHYRRYNGRVTAYSVGRMVIESQAPQAQQARENDRLVRASGQEMGVSQPVIDQIAGVAVKAGRSLEWKPRAWFVSKMQGVWGAMPAGGVGQFSVYTSNSKAYVANLTEKEYNSFGWIRANDVMSAGDYYQFTRYYADHKANGHYYVKTEDGYTIIPVGKNLNVLVYAKGPIKCPEIAKVIVLENVTRQEASQIRSDILEAERNRDNATREFIAHYYRETIFVEYESNNYPFDRQLANRGAEGTSGGDGVVDRGVGGDRGGSVDEGAGSSGQVSNTEPGGVFYTKDGEIGGYYDRATGRIYLNGELEAVKAGEVREILEFILKHEIAHSIETHGGWDTITRICRKEMGADTFDAAVEQMMADRAAAGDTVGATQEGAKKEVVADWIGKNFFKREFAKTIAARHKGLANTIALTFSNIRRVLGFTEKGRSHARMKYAEELYLKAIAETATLTDEQIAARLNEGIDTVPENESGEASGETSGQFEILHNVEAADGTIYPNIVAVEYDVFKGYSQHHWKKPLREFVENDLAGKTITVYDDAGNAKIIQFAKKNERVKKDDATHDHQVLGKLHQKTDRNSQLAVANSIELVEISFYESEEQDHSHQWMDENGWEYRKSYMMLPDGRIYEVTLNIARTRDGRNVLYDINKIHQVATGKNHTNNNSQRAGITNLVTGTTVPQNADGVKKNNPSDGQASIIPQSVIEADRETVAREGITAAEAQAELDSVVDEDVEGENEGTTTPQSPAATAPLTRGAKGNVEQGGAKGSVEQGGAKGSGQFSLVDGGRYDYSKSFAEQIDDWKNGNIPQKDTLIVSGTPNTWQEIGFTALPITINQTHVDYAVNGTKDADHHIGETALKQLPQMLKTPIAIIESQSQAGRVVAILQYQHNGKNTIAAVEVDGYGQQNNTSIDSHAVTSVFAKSNAITKLLYDAVIAEANGNKAMFRWNKKEAISLLQTKGLQLPSSLPHDGFIHSISDSGSNVKKRFSNQTETQQFKRWFGKSKAVNDDGTPKVFYHGTNADFTEFQSVDGAYWFSESQDYAEAMMEERGGSRVMPVYLRMENPYVTTLPANQFSNPVYEKPILRQAKANGHDGVIIKNDTDSEYAADTFAVVFDPTQIKSATDNIGTFDRNNPDIQYSIIPQSVIEADREAVAREGITAAEAQAELDSVVDEDVEGENEGTTTPQSPAATAPLTRGAKGSVEQGGAKGSGQFSIAYTNAPVNGDVLALVERIKSGNYKDNDVVRLSKVSDETAKKYRTSPALM